MVLLGVAVAVCVGTWLAYLFALRLNRPQRKLMLYLLVFAPFVPLAAENKGIGAMIAVYGFMLAIPAFFAVLMAPEKN